MKLCRLYYGDDAYLLDILNDHLTQRIFIEGRGQSSRTLSEISYARNIAKMFGCGDVDVEYTSAYYATKIIKMVPVLRVENLSELYDKYKEKYPEEFL